MRKKGFEPIVAALLLTIITIIAAAAIYLWSSGLMSGAGAGAARFSFQVDVYDAAITDADSNIDTADTENDDLVVSAILKNTGNAPITVTGLKVRDLTKGTDFTDVSSSAYIGTTLVANTYTMNPGEIVDTKISILDVASTFSAEPGDRFELLFIFSDGTTYSLIVQTRGT